MTTEENGAGKITYTVRELLAEIKTTVSNIDAKLDTKAERSIVENLEKRLVMIETQRATEAQYGNELLKEYRELLKEHSQVKLDINSLKTNKKDKEAFNTLWIPILFNTICTVALAIYGVLHIH